MLARTQSFDDGTVCYWAGEHRRDGLPWLVFLPGLTADHRLFARQIKHFEGKANCLVWDAPSHGKSRPFPLNWSYRDLARMLHNILEAEGVRRPILVGQSMGGYISQVFLELYPGEAAGFVSIDSCSLQRNYYAGWELWALKHTHLMYLSIPWGLLVSWGSKGCATSARGQELMAAMMRDYEKREYCALAAHGYRELARAVEVCQLREIPCPVLFICGEKDAAGAAKRYNEAWSKNTGLPVHWIAGAGHNSNVDSPDEVNALIEGFVTEAGKLLEREQGTPS
ncbi:MAG: alpha/beta hydrolase [Coriobacteriia bacterium]|nr:alpha/beta hydrolase [Coriobacteriia bacterium]